MIARPNQPAASRIAASVRTRLVDVALVFHGEHALEWPEARTLFIADTHFGKASTFRAAGIPAPRGTTARDLERIASLVRATDVERLIVLGDLLHARQGRLPDTMASIAAWRDAHRQLGITLIRGNHDLRSGDPPSEWNIDCLGEPHGLGPFTLRHHPPEPGQGPVGESRITLAGHVHPAVVLRDRAGQRGRFCAFVAQPCAGPSPHWLLTLPAFGSFTGCKAVTPTERARVWAVVDGAVVGLQREPDGEDSVSAPAR
jgi:DNA ligase-associated metallophosphoesterase